MGSTPIISTTKKDACFKAGVLFFTWEQAEKINDIGSCQPEITDIRMQIAAVPSSIPTTEIYHFPPLLKP